ncbi:hsp90 co-chaperone Cdc37 [Malassezia vespertilionis]|uniref:Hsp90 chaperone protein kinase-targeting subunit n=1 Tax=Malassezia vespertilionis TaxID=2020962 RepID=A0A2N1JFH3_9BASI|nr:hsp90 co-chaperone Cdc37 [Malassezia vespertilionis]PKI85292.1 Cdc37p [Malassezia vespertilionis]WFD05508.1 hsp90 co-chaperone Cdc37 [Malassezia vespertilionis]
MSKLNYSKWDNLELSDDSDIEVHPNVDKRSFIQWKQRDIHEKREQRKIQRSMLEAEQRTNTDLAPRMLDLITRTRGEGAAFYSRQVSQLAAVREARGNKDGPDGPTLDDMLLSLLLQINAEPAVQQSKGDDTALAAKLTASLETALERLGQRQEQIKNELAEMADEDARKITSDNLREGWDGSHVSRTEEPASIKSSEKAKEQRIETLNPGARAKTGESRADSDEEEESAPTVTPVMKSFASLPTVLEGIPLTADSLPPAVNPLKQLKLDRFEKIFQFLGSHKELLREDMGASDALLLQAFESQMAGQKQLARMCTEKALLLQYCNKLGKDGVGLFFKRMMGSDGKAATIFLNDVLATYTRIANRAAELATEYKEDGVEQIQLVAEDPSTVITFQIPDGPPPETIKLEGEGTESMDVEQVREWLQRRWDIFTSFDEDFRRALETNDIKKVNNVLGNMPVDKAEKVVQDLDFAGILDFSSTEVQDETNRS